MTKICHLTSVHRRYDTRIFLKECCSLSKFFETYLVVADGKGEEIKNNVRIIDVGLSHSNRFERMTKTTKKIYKTAKKLNCEVYHIHDPELIPIGLKLKKEGKKVIYDAHEDLPKQLLTKPYLNKSILKILSLFSKKYLSFALKKFDGLVAATPQIKKSIEIYNENTVNINNYPIIDEFILETNWELKKNEICYIGGISKIRGIEEMIRAMEKVEGVILNLAGDFENNKLKSFIQTLPAWERVNYWGFVNRSQVSKILLHSKIGIVLLHPVPNYINSFPIKMFEYFAAGIPVVASNFPIWKEIVENNKCGICVDPLNPEKIAEAINYLISNDKIAYEMGQNGKKLVLEKYNWSVEEKKLTDFYYKIVQNDISNKKYKI